ncbi:MAG: acyl-ACP--UDP-N-acetylglucosamine O-acyltransferase [Desulfobulbaceae bacterium]|jgi:UDP-N-acetylglucosamine acyltransferase|nr:acyl-ACP--UDP-N-acetylglucosamine O-acyltransferase [Desulfobulbaceae bacterium]
MPIHPTAVIDKTAQLDTSVEVGPYAVIGAHVRIDADSMVEAHASVKGPTFIGKRNVVSSFAAVGGDPQDISYKKGDASELHIGDDNKIREYATLQRGTQKGDGRTLVGNGNLFMAYSHVAHDCRVGDHVIMANVATLAGHVEIENHATLGGLVAVQQFCRIGAYSYIGGTSGITFDVPPYVILEGTRNQMRIAGLNKVGLRRNGFSRETIGQLDKAFRLLFRSPDLLLQDALTEARASAPDCPEVIYLVEFIKNSKNGVVRRALGED